MTDFTCDMYIYMYVCKFMHFSFTIKLCKFGRWMCTCALYPTLVSLCVVCRCEQALISVVAVRNCIKLYQTSEEHSAENLKNYCLQIISSHWVGFCVCMYMYMYVRW